MASSDSLSSARSCSVVTGQAFVHHVHLRTLLLGELLLLPFVSRLATLQLVD